MSVVGSEFTRSREARFVGLINQERTTTFRLACGHCGAACVRKGAWIAQNRVFMCGHCFQDTQIDLVALSAPAREDSKGSFEPERICLPLAPLRLVPRRAWL
ncbi:hypothetical protein SLNSH_08755 [Alsobacter soli]|uniref:Uncharacterized protein n=1 Tax=Alsobacter soli TaxID=2109933 RepID=A0A2T1HUH7_9HYPH|nr:hypothetical protein [Alsobacter soli]PSC05294.1 hypothetical protein SLNSH_08755 [Alsobacter soli]